ncbi:MAG: hypothetical protein R2727_03260 [Bacteroidales bacterium]
MTCCGLQAFNITIVDNKIVKLNNHEDIIDGRYQKGGEAYNTFYVPFGPE